MRKRLSDLKLIRAVKEVRFQYSVRSLVAIFCAAAFGAGIAAYFTPLWMETLATFLVVSFLILILNHDHPLRFFLKYVNPLIAVVVLAICVFAASTEYQGGKLVYEGWFKEPIQSYFLAKGIFCATAIFLFGKLVEITLRNNSAK